MIVIYTKPSNDSCRFAIQWFQDKNIPYFERRICAQRPLRKEELTKILSLTTNGFEDVLSSRSSIYNQIKHRFHNTTYENALGLIIEFPSLLRAPIIVDFGKHKIEAGFNEEKIRSFLSREYKKTVRKKYQNRVEYFI